MEKRRKTKASKKAAKQRKSSRKDTKKRRVAQGRAGIDELASGIWPSERDIMARPDRYKYVRKLISQDTCVFCTAKLKGPGIESLVVYRSELAMVVLNKFPYNTGHLLVLPTRHCGNLTDLSEMEYLELMSLVRRTFNILQKAYSCSGFNIGLNHGAVAGAGIPDHLHWHIIPRWHGDTNFFPLIAETKVVSETLEQTYNRICPFFGE
jgi:ATP adenylyltransferase